MPNGAFIAAVWRTGCLLLILALWGCGNPEDLDWGYGPNSSGDQQPGVPRIPESPGASGNALRAMIYIGDSTWLAEVDSIEQSLRHLGIGYREINAQGLSDLSV